jgi:hypothetical protein
MERVKQSWERARRSYHYPSLKEPKMVRGLSGGAAFDFRRNETLVDEGFVEKTSKSGNISQERCLEGIFTHEIGHYMVFPETLGRFILAAKITDDFFSGEDKEIRGFILQTYSDMANDLDSVLKEQRTDVVLDLRNACQFGLEGDELNHNVRELMLAYLHHQARRDYELRPELMDYLERMKTIDFLDRNVTAMRVGIWTFGNIVRDMIKRYGPDDDRGGEPGRKEDERPPGGDGEPPPGGDGRLPPGGDGPRGRGQGKGPRAPGEDDEGGKGEAEEKDEEEQKGKGKDENQNDEEGAASNLRDCDVDEILARATEEDIRQALREISDQISKKEHDKVREWLESRGVPQPEQPKVVHIGTSAGDLPVDQAVLEYYRQLSMNYDIVVAKKLMETEGKMRCWSDTEKWRPGRDPNLALPGSTGGRFLPGITRSIRIDETPVRTVDYDTPHLLVVIDSSGSMPVPAEIKSYSVLGAYCAARSYHLHGSHIGVINFSGQSFYLPYTRELDEALGAISAYQGGGTAVDLDMIGDMLRPGMAEFYQKNSHLDMRGLPKEAIIKNVQVGVPQTVFSADSIDLLMFTDGGIANLDETLELFRGKGQLNRATIVLTHGMFEQEIKDISDERFNVHLVERDMDIPNIVIRETQNNLSQFSRVDR